jgi:hypothetical protein
MSRQTIDDQRLFALVRGADPLAASDIDAGDPGAHLLEQVLAAPRHARVGPQLLRRRRVATLVAIGVAVVAVSSAIGAVALVRLLNGQPAPPAVIEELHGGSAAGEVQLTTSSGEVATLYAAEMNGHDCAYLRVSPATATEFTPANHRGAAVCTSPASETAAVRFATDGAMRTGGSWFEFVYGKVSPAVANVSLRNATGQETPLPLSDGYFLYELTPSDGTTGLSLITRDSSGQQLEETTLAPITTGPGQR